MKTRCILSHATLGEKTIDGPDGIKALTLNLKRHEDYHSLFENFDGEFWFFGADGNIDGGLDFILEAEQLDGPDCTIDLVFRIAPDDMVYTTIFTGQLLLAGINKNDMNRARIPIIRNDFSAKFKNRVDTPVDIQSEQDLDGNTADVFDNVEIDLLPQKLPMTFEGLSEIMGIETGATDINSFPYFQSSWDEIELEEVEEYFLLPQVGNPVEPAENFNIKYAGEYRIQAQTNAWFPTLVFGVGEHISDYVEPYLNIDGVETLMTLLPSPFVGRPDYGEWVIDITQNLSVGSQIKMYFKLVSPVPGLYTGDFRWNGRYFQVIPFSDPYIFDSTINVTGQTVYPATRGDCFLVHDVGGMITDRTIGRSGTFYSEYLGSDRTLYRQYDEEGCAWENILIKGLQLRQYLLSDKPFFISFKQWWDGINPIYCLGLGYETINGVEVMRAEERGHFYDPEPSLYLDNVTIERSYDETVMIKTFRNGYKKWQSENVSGIDDPQTKQTRASRLQKSGKDLIMESEFIAASLAIETTRRTTIKKSADYKFDDDVFIISVNPVDVSPAAQYEPKFDEGFSSITNLQNPDTRYNTLLSPARNFMRWSKWLFGGLQNYVGSFFKFTGGEGNYDMVSDYDVSDGCEEYSEPLSEKQNIEVTSDHFHRAEVYDISCQATFENYLTIKENSKKAIALSQTTTNHQIFIIKELNFKPFDSTLTGEVWGYDFFDPQVIEESGLDQVCYPPESEVETCVDALLTELSLELITEDSECLVLE